MSSRERILAALHGKPIDRIPFVPLIDLYTILDLPQATVQEVEDLGYHLGLLLVSRQMGVDVMLRHVLATETYRVETTYLETLGRFQSPIKVYSVRKEDLHAEFMETPVGNLEATWGFTDRVSWIPHPIKHLVNNYEEMKIFHYAIDHLSEERVKPNHEYFLFIDHEIGEDGIATTSISNTPLMYLIEMIWGLENTYYLLSDYQDEVEDILAKLHQPQKRYVEELAKTPAEVVIQYENTSSTLLSPNVFRKYCLPYLNIYADILKAGDKIFLAHMCGKIHSFLDELQDGHFDGIADIAPPPTGDLPLDEAAANLAGKSVIGGIDATTFVNEDSGAVESEITHLIERLKPYPGVLLGSADTAPRGISIENFHLIQRLAATVGSFD